MAPVCAPAAVAAVRSPPAAATVNMLRREIGFMGRPRRASDGMVLRLRRKIALRGLPQRGRSCGNYRNPSRRSTHMRLGCRGLLPAPSKAGDEYRHNADKKDAVEGAG